MEVVLPPHAPDTNTHLPMTLGKSQGLNRTGDPQTATARDL